VSGLQGAQQELSEKTATENVNMTVSNLQPDLQGAQQEMAEKTATENVNMTVSLEAADSHVYSLGGTLLCQLLLCSLQVRLRE